jgi:hypothetical protein
MEKDNRVVTQFSLPRSGGTFLYQIFKLIFKDVITSHRHIGNTNIIIYRNFFDSFISFYRIKNDSKSDFIISKKSHLDVYIKLYCEYVNELFKYKNELKGKLIFEYDKDIYLGEGKNKYEHIFSKIENYFKIKINNKNEIIEYTNYDINKQRSAQYSSFKKYNKETLIHGQHVSSGEKNEWKKHLIPELHEHLIYSSLGKKYDEWLKVLNDENYYK